MKIFLTAWVGTLILGWVAVNVFGALGGYTGLLLLGVTVIALLISVIASLSESIDRLQERMERLESRVSPEEPEPRPDEDGRPE